jgi:radical SAM superfamily enzyme YgiQ (UPF0313 family)
MHGEMHYQNTTYAGKLSAAVIFPSLYSLGISNLGFLTVHRLLSAIPSLGVERFFPALQAGAILKPPYYSFETWRPLGDFDLFLFSFSFEGDFDKIPSLFAALGLPILASERNKNHPILICGGAAIASNPEALSLIFDIIIPSEAETTLLPVMDILMSKGYDRQLIAEIPGVWVPALSQTFRPTQARHNVNLAPAYSHIISKDNVFGGAHIIEVMRGCPRGCAFCLARSIYSPPREVSLDTLEKWLDERPKCTDVGLVAPSLFDHSQIDEILEMLTERKIRIRNSSVKWEKISSKAIELLRSAGITSITVAPESGSDEMRRAMGKPMDEGRFLSKLQELFASGFEHIKMYFVLCAPGETDGDADETLGLIERVLALAPSYKAVSATFSVFVPKNHTTWSQEEPPTQYEIKKRVKYIKAGLSKLPAQFKATFESPQEVLRQAYLSKVGPELAEEYIREARECRENLLFSKNISFIPDF